MQVPMVPGRPTKGGGATRLHYRAVSKRVAVRKPTRAS